MVHVGGQLLASPLAAERHAFISPCECPPADCHANARAAASYRPHAEGGDGWVPCACVMPAYLASARGNGWREGCTGPCGLQPTSNWPAASRGSHARGVRLPCGTCRAYPDRTLHYSAQVPPLPKAHERRCLAVCRVTSCRQPPMQPLPSQVALHATSARSPVSLFALKPRTAAHAPSGPSTDSRANPRRYHPCCTSPPMPPPSSCLPPQPWAAPFRPCSETPPSRGLPAAGTRRTPARWRRPSGRACAPPCGWWTCRWALAGHNEVLVQASNAVVYSSGGAVNSHVPVVLVDMWGHVGWGRERWGGAGHAVTVSRSKDSTRSGKSCSSCPLLRFAPGACLLPCALHLLSSMPLSTLTLTLALPVSPRPVPPAGPVWGCWHWPASCWGPRSSPSPSGSRRATGPSGVWTSSRWETRAAGNA